MALLLISLVGIFTLGVAWLAVGVVCVIQAILYWTSDDATFHQKYVVERRWF